MKGEIMKQPLRITIGGIAWMLASSIVIAPTPGAAAPRYSGTITGFFDGPVLSGAFLQPVTRQRISQDNASSTVGSGIGTSSLTWGDKGGAPLAPSALTLTGNSFSDVASGQVFPLGTLTYFNGMNTPSALIFGVTMHLSAGDGITPFTGPVAIVSTQNGGSDRVADADLLSFGNFEVPSTLAAFEGTAVTAVIFGRIAGESQLEITSIALAEGEADHGCVDSAPLADSSLPCASACGDFCAAAMLALAGPLCGSERLPGALNRRIGQARQLLSQVSGTDTERKARKGVTRVMKQLQRSVAIARRAAKKGRISAACAEAVAKAVANAQSQAEPWLGTRAP